MCCLRDYTQTPVKQPHKIKTQNSVHAWTLHETPGVQEKCTQVIYLKDQSIRSHEDPYVMYRIDTGFVHQYCHTYIHILRSDFICYIHIIILICFLYFTYFIYTF